jgi:hypothetical protein
MTPETAYKPINWGRTGLFHQDFEIVQAYALPLPQTQNDYRQVLQALARKTEGWAAGCPVSVHGHLYEVLAHSAQGLLVCAEGTNMFYFTVVPHNIVWYHIAEATSRELHDALVPRGAKKLGFKLRLQQAIGAAIQDKYHAYRWQANALFAKIHRAYGQELLLGDATSTFFTEINEQDTLRFQTCVYDYV